MQAKIPYRVAFSVLVIAAAGFYGDAFEFIVENSASITITARVGPHITGRRRSRTTTRIGTTGGFLSVVGMTGTLGRFGHAIVRTECIRF